MCEYCEGDIPRKAIACVGGNTLGIPTENNLIAQRNDEKMAYIWAKINYCPMCGKKLKVI